MLQFSLTYCFGQLTLKNKIVNKMQRRINRVDKYQPPAPQPQQPEARRTSTSSKQSELREWFQRMLESKVRQLHRQIASNNQTIRVLSERLKQCQRELQRKQRLLLNTSNSLQQSNISRSDLIEISNKLLNDKLREKFSDVNNAIAELQNKKLAKNSDIESYQARMEDRINRNVYELKAGLKEKCEEIKNNNSVYWNKIKGWAKMFEEKMGKCDSNVGLLIKETDTLEQMVNSSVMGLYKLKNFATRIKEVQMAVYDLEESFKIISETQIELKDLIDNRIDLSYSKDEFTYRLEDCKLDQELVFTSVSAFTKPKEAKSQSKSFGKKEQNSYDFRNQTMPKYDNKFDSKYDIKYDTKLDTKLTTKYQPTNKSSRLESSSSASKFQAVTKFQNLCVKPHPPPPLLMSHSKTLPNDNNSLLSNFGEFEQHPDTSRSSSFKSLAQSRKQMVVDIRKRLRAMSDEKKVPLPIPCFLDEISYLKNSYNNYIFDCRGNMFKMKKEDFQQLCQEGLLSKV